MCSNGIFHFVTHSHCLLSCQWDDSSVFFPSHMTFLHTDKNPLILPFFRLSTSSQCLRAGQMLHSFNHHGPVLDSPWKILVFLTVGSPALGSAPHMCLPTAEERHPLPWPAGNALPNAVFVGYLCRLMVNFPTSTHRFSPASSKGTSTIL